MRRFLIVLSLITFTTDSAFAACDPGYTEDVIQIPSGYADSIGDYPKSSGTGSNTSGLSRGQWKAVFGDKTLKGETSCNGTSGSVGEISNSSFTTSSTGQYCWCKVTEYNGTTLTSKWVFNLDWASSSFCASGCPRWCARRYDEYSEQDDDEGPADYAVMRSSMSSSVTGSTTCNACPAKPDGAVWTTGCDFTCSAGTYQSSVTSSVTFPTTAPDSTTNSGTNWSATWSGDTASGTSGCSSSSSSYTPSGRYCWCKLTSWNSTSLTASWIYAARLSSSTCSSSCASSCASKMNSDSTFRSNSFNSVTNTPTVTTTTCPSCPSGGTSNAGSTEITQCYVPTTQTMTDAAGTYTFSSNCYYSE